LATLILIVLIVAVTIAGFSSRTVVERTVLRPYQVARGKGYATLISSGFVHADLSHLLFNLITFYSFGFRLERVIGTTPFVVLYLAALLASSLGTTFKHRNEPEYASLGASGAILGILFASIAYFPASKLIIFPLPIPLPAALFAVGYLAFSYYSSRFSKGRVNHDAHIVGALTGVAFVAITDPQTLITAVRSVTGGG